MSAKTILIRGHKQENNANSNAYLLTSQWKSQYRVAMGKLTHFLGVTN